MLSFGIFKTRKPRQFNYQPLYYDPDKQAREERRKELLGSSAIKEPAQGPYKPGMYIRSSMAARRGMTPRSGKAQRSVLPVRLLVLACLLALVLWFFFRY